MNQTEYYDRIIIEYIIECEAEVMWSRYDRQNKDYTGPVRACIICSDIFAWGGADCQVVEPEDIDELIWFAKRGDKMENYNGSIMWVCHKRKRRPQKPYLVDKYTDRGWRDWLDLVVPLAESTRGEGEVIEEDTAR